MIAIDAMFSPVTRVRFKVEATRVGQETNLNRLEITIETDGSISPQAAFEEANAILVNQYTALAGSTTVESAPALGTQRKMTRVSSIRQSRNWASALALPMHLSTTRFVLCMT